MAGQGEEKHSEKSPFNPIPWAISIAILIFAWSLSKRPLNECEPTSFEAFQFFKLQFRGCTKTQVEPVPKGVKAQVYVQIADESQRDSMRTLQDNLKSLGYSVPGIENISGKADIPKNPNVRYFNDADKATAEAVVVELKKFGYTSAYPYKVNMKAPIGALEVWLPKP